MELTESYFDQVKQGLKRCLTPEQTQDYLIVKIKQAYYSGCIDALHKNVLSNHERAMEQIKNLQTEIEKI
jgi:hypothetical protein